MIRFNIDTNSKAAVYRQLVDAVTEAVRKGSLKAGELVPSMNALADELRISKETVKRAYNILSKNGILEARQGKGFYVADDSTKDSVSVLFLMDKFSIYKQEIVHGFHQVLTVKSEDTILLFNQDISLFEYFINENLGRYDYYIISRVFRNVKGFSEIFQIRFFQQQNMIFKGIGINNKIIPNIFSLITLIIAFKKPNT